MSKKQIYRYSMFILCTLCLILIFSTMPVQAAAPSVEFSVHLQDKGWTDYTKDGNVAGTTGKACRMEAIKIRLKNATGKIWYKAYIQDAGWQDWVANDAVSGTEGESKRMEAIKIQLTGSITNTHDVFYRVYVGEIGWLGWTKNGSIAGTTDLGLRIEAIQIVLKKKKQPEKMSTSYLTKPTLKVNAHVQDMGWIGYVGEGQTAGTEGKSLRMEAINIICSDLFGGSGINYQVHIQDIGWQDFKSSGRTAGTIGQSKAIEAIKIQTDGYLSKVYDIYYRVHVKDIGWMGWAKNGEFAGTTGGGRPMEAIQIKMLLKDDNMDRGGNAYQDLTSQFSTQIPAIRSVGTAGINLIKNFEKCKLTAYKAVSSEKYYTIGWGHYGLDVTQGMTITQAQADQLLEQDIKKYEGYLNAFLDKYNISVTQAQYDALLSFTYNVGNQWVKTSSFQLKNILINGANHYMDSQIRTAFTNWNKSGGKALPGLTKRRNAEADLFLTNM